MLNESPDTICVVDSIDTDIMAIAVLRQYTCLVRVSFTHKGLKRYSLFDPAVCRSWVHSSRPSTHNALSIEEAAEDLVKVYVASGTDFVTGIKGISNTKFLESYLLQCQTADPYIDAQLKSHSRATIPSSNSTLYTGAVNASKRIKLAHVALVSDPKLIDPVSFKGRVQFTMDYWSDQNKTYPLGMGFGIIKGNVRPTEMSIASLL
jgi:hypothetical protein